MTARPVSQGDQRSRVADDAETYPAPDIHAELVLPTPMIDKIAAVAAKLVLEQLDAQHGPDDGNSLMTVVEAADYLRCKPQRIYDLVSSQRLPKFKDGTRTLVRRADLDLHITS